MSTLWGIVQKADEMLCEELRKPAEYFKNKKKGDNNMYDIDIFDLLTDESKESVMKQLKEAKEQAKKDGLAEGRAEGEKLGIAKALLETAKNLLKLGIPNDKIAEATKLDIEEIKALSAQMA